MSKIVCLVALLALASPCLAQTDPAAAPAPKPKKERKECRSTTPTGSRIPDLTCHTKAEWAVIDQQQSTIDTQRTVDAARSSR